MAAQKRPAFRLKGLKFHVEIAELEIDGGGEQSAVPQLKGMFAEKLARAIEPVAQGLLPGVDVTPPASAAVVPVEPEKRARRPARPRAANSPASSGAGALPWRPTSTPDGAWSAGKKALWLLHCYSKENGGSEAAPKGLAAKVVIATYNHHFPFASPVHSSHVYRDLKKSAAAQPPLVRVDRNANPPVWYITPAGSSFVEDLMRTPAATASAPSAA
jgi:hypothetical protein